jgi:CSLREA domain-containing protein
MSARSKVVTSVVVLIVIMAGVLNLAPAAWAAPQSAAVTITVNTLQDVINPSDSKCSLREALQRAADNAASSLPNDCPASPGGFTTIKFSVSGVIVISNAVDGGQLPNIVNTVTLQGPITLDMGQATQIVLDVESNGRLNLINMTIKNAKWTALDTRGEVNIANVTFENNGAGGAGGGAIRNDGKAVIAGSKFINNRAVNAGMEGGAIRTTWDLSCSGCTFTGNTADKNGGAIALKGGRLAIADSTFTGNVVKGSLLSSALGEGGGAIYTSASSNTYPMTIKRSTFSGNYATEGVGGAIFHNANVDLTITDSSFQGNGAGSPSGAGSGGAIRNISPMTIKRSMFIANSAIGDGGAISNDYYGTLTLRLVGFVGNTASVKGGAIANLNGSSSVASISVIGASLTGNIADSQGGGIYNHDSKYDTAEFRLSVWAGNLPQNCRDQNSLDDKLPDPLEAIPPIDSKGQNSFSDDTCEDDDPDPTDQHNADPKLEEPAPNGGLIPGLLTQKPKPDSPLVDAIAPAAYPTNDPDVGNQDVRGLPRPMNGDGIGLPLFDIGPFELDDASPDFSSLPAAPGPINLGTFQVGTTYTKTDALKVYNGGAADLTINNVAIGGANAADFKIDGIASTLGYLGGDTVGISCTPGGSGQRTATLSFNTNDPDKPNVSFNLQCTGQAAAAAGFGSTPNQPGPIQTSTVVGTAKVFTLTVKETGNSQLVLSGFSLVSTPPGAIIMPALVTLVINDGGAAKGIGLACAGDSIGLATGTLNFSTNDPAHPTVSFNVNCTVIKADEMFFPMHSSTTVGLGTVAGPYGIAISPDGKHVYAADAGDSAVVAYSVDPDYTLTYINRYLSSDLAAGNQFAAPYQVYVSPDGMNVYVTGNAGDAIATYTRDASTGALTHLSTAKNGDNYGCLPSPCDGTVSGLDGAYGIAISPDGKFAYVSGVVEDSVVVFGRNKTTGDLVDFFGGPMFRQRFTNPNLNGAYGIALSPDGQNLYVTGYTSDALLTLKRDASTGQLSTAQVLTTTATSGLNGVFRVIVSPDGRFVYTAAYDGDATCVFQRSALDGTLTFLDCRASILYHDAASDLALMPDGKHLIVSAFNTDGVTVYDRNPQTGLISYADAIVRNGLPLLDGARGVVAHPSGKAVYATGYLDDAVVTLLVRNPRPVLTSLSPASRPMGSGAFTLTVNGADFSPNSVVRYNGANRPTIFLNETQLLVKLTSGDVASAGSVVISVNTPTPGGGNSEFKSFVVLAAGALPIPSISQINTQGALAGSGPITVEVQGDNFAAKTIVLFNGQPRATTFINSQLLRAQLLAADVAQVGLGAITVQNSTLLDAPSAPDATSQSSTVAINVLVPSYNPPPGITQISPASGRALDLVPVAQIEVTITGTNFLPESRVLWNDVEYPTQYINSTTLKLIVSAGDLAVPGVASVKVSNPAPGGGLSNVKTFTILDPVIPQRIYIPVIIK